MEEIIIRNRRLIVSIVFLIIIGLIGYAIYLQVSRIGKIPIIIAAVPSDTKVVIDGQTTSSGTFYVKPGTYTVTGKKDGFADFSHSVYIKDANQLIAVPLEAVSDEARSWAEKNISDYNNLEGKVGSVVNQEGEAFRSKNPIVDLLPFSNYIYTIGYSADTSDPSGNSIILQINASEGYRQAAINQIRQWGYDPTEFIIKFNDYKNPFTS
jgi:PEGA domain-containing protein